MIRSTKIYTKKMDRQNPKRNGKSKLIQTKSHKQHTHTHKKRKRKKKIYIYIKGREQPNQ